MEEVVVTYHYVKNPDDFVGWFDQLHAVVMTNHFAGRLVRRINAGKEVLAIKYGSQTKRVMGGKYTAKATPVLLDFHRHVTKWPSRKPVSEERLAFLLGFYTVCVENDGSIRKDDDGNPVVLFDTDRLTKFMRQFAAYKTYCLVSFMTVEEEELYNQIKFK
jgi:hypothetical protein